MYIGENRETIRLPQDTRTFVRISETTAQLCRSGKCVRAGTALVVSELQIMVYDHRDQHVVWFREPGDETAYYLIVAETGVAELMESVNN